MTDAGQGDVAIEVKISNSIDKTDMHGLQAFHEYADSKKSVVVCTVDKPRKLTLDSLEIDILPWKFFLEQLWAGKIIS